MRSSEKSSYSETILGTIRAQDEESLHSQGIANGESAVCMVRLDWNSSM